MRDQRVRRMGRCSRGIVRDNVYTAAGCWTASVLIVEGRHQLNIPPNDNTMKINPLAILIISLRESTVNVDARLRHTQHLLYSLLAIPAIVVQMVLPTYVGYNFTIFIPGTTYRGWTDCLTAKYQGSRLSIDYFVGKYLGYCLYVLFAFTYHIALQRC